MDVGMVRQRRLADDIVAAAMIDRIVHHGRMITFTGQSYRMANALMK